MIPNKAYTFRKFIISLELAVIVIAVLISIVSPRCGLLKTAIASNDSEDVVESNVREHQIAHPNLLPLRDHVVIQFNESLDILRESQKLRFGIFRDQDPRDVQWVEEKYDRVNFPRMEKPVGFLKLRYEVPVAGTFNGWWFKLENADWSEFQSHDLVLRLRLDQEGDANYTSVFKIELKTLSDGDIITHLAYVRIDKKHLKTNQEQGYFDVAIPMKAIARATSLVRMHEFVVVFENTRVTSKTGDLLVHSIRLRPPANDDHKNDVQVLLDSLARRAFLWFSENRNEKTGLVLDRSPNASYVRDRPAVCSMASVGYYLSILPGAIRTGQISREKAIEHSEQVMGFVLNNMQNRKGLLYHFVDVSTGKPLAGSEVSCLDSAIFFNGCMVVAEEFGGQTADLADSIVDRAEWSAFVVKHPRTKESLLSLGWDNKKGLLGPMDVRSSEMAMPYFLAVGSRTHPINPDLWYNTNVTKGRVGERDILNQNHSLFTSYYGLGWHRLKGLVDRDNVDLDANAREAALVNREFCQSVANKHKTYAKQYGGWWGISAGDSPNGYIAPGPIFGDANSTVWPMAALATVSWIPDVLEEDLDQWRKSEIWSFVSGPYGLAPFNLDKSWIGPDLIGIDLGSYYLNLENHRNGTIHRLWMRHPVAQNAIERLEYRAKTTP